MTTPSFSLLSLTKSFFDHCPPSPSPSPSSLLPPICFNLSSLLNNMSHNFRFYFLQYIFLPSSSIYPTCLCVCMVDHRHWSLLDFLSEYSESLYLREGERERERKLESLGFLFRFWEMGSCFSTTKVSGSNSNTPSTTTATTAVNNNQQNRRSAAAAKPASTNPQTVIPRKQESSHSNNQKTREHKNQQHKPFQHNVKNHSKRPSGVIPCGKRTDFGYDKDFDMRYTIGKLLGHGQFGYTYVAIDKSNGNRVAVKKIDKNKVIFLATFSVFWFSFFCYVSFCM